jgi:hypothetical protein
MDRFRARRPYCRHRYSEEQMEEFLEWLNAERGRRALLALRMGLAPSTITQWVRRNQIPFWQVKGIERITGIPGGNCARTFLKSRSRRRRQNE